MKSKMPQFADELQTCLGVPLRDERPFDDNERNNLRAQMRSSLLIGCTSGCSAPAAFLLFLALFALIVDGNEESNFRVVIGMVFLIASLVSMAALFLIMKDKITFYKAIKRDLRNGNIKRYQGKVPGARWLEEYEKMIAAVEVDFSQPVTLEVFSASRYLYKVNGVKVARSLILEEERTARRPEAAEIAAKWVVPSRITEDDKLDISDSGQRELSESEKEEIRHYIRRIRWKLLSPCLWTLFVGANFIRHSFHLWNSVTPHTKWLSGTLLLIVPIVFFVLTIYGIFYLVNVIRDIRLFWRDAKGGMVIITREPDLEEDEVLIPGTLIEWLPNSGFVWSIDGETAAWRLRQ